MGAIGLISRIGWIDLIGFIGLMGLIVPIFLMPVGFFLKCHVMMPSRLG